MDMHTLRRSTLPTVIILFSCFFAVLLAAGIVSPAKFFPRGQHEGISLIRDDQELRVYYDRVAFYRQGDPPYKYSRIEYPPLGVLYLTIPAVFSKTFDQYKLILMGENLIFGLGLIVVTYYVFRLLQKKSGSLWLFILPSFLFYLINRFDVLPAFLVQLSLFFLFKKKFGWAFTLLSLSFLAKGYAVILFPIFFIYYLNQTKQPQANLFKNKWLWVMVLPTAAVTLIICLVAGLNNGLFPYIFQTTRDFAYGAVYVIYLQALQPILSGGLWSGLIAVSAKVLTFLQIALPLMLYTGYQFFRKYVQTTKQAINWSVLVMSAYILFSVYYSPQWFVWLLPLLILVVSSKRLIMLIVLYDVLNYFQFPVIWDSLGVHAVSFEIVVLLRTIILVLFIVLSVKEIINTGGQPKFSSTPATGTLPAS